VTDARGTGHGVPGPGMSPAEEFRYLVLAAQREGNRMLLEALRPLGLTPSQAEAIRVLHDHGPLSLVDLGVLLVCETSSPSRLVDGLVAAGLADREPAPGDRRRVVLSLTGAGRACETAVRDVEAAIYGFIGDALGEDQLEVANTALRTVVQGRPAGIAVERRRGGSHAS
jgi:DNA-binding MarR family transcriptional regulator